MRREVGKRLAWVCGSRDCFGLWRVGGVVGLWSFGFRGFERRRAGLITLELSGLDRLVDLDWVE